MNDFKDFLEQHAYGGQLDSSGHFTLGKEKALEKMAEMALAEPAQWVLKMVQAAVSRSCWGMKFRLGRRVAQVEFFGPEIDLRQLQDGLLDPSYAPNAFWEEMFVALRTLLFRGQFRLRDSKGDWVAWDGQSLHHQAAEPESEPEAKEEGPIPSLSVLVSLMKEKDRAIESRDMHTLLADRAVYAPLQLVVDGREIRPEHKFAVREPDFTVGYPIWTAPLLYAHFQKGHLEQRLQYLEKAPSRPYSDALRNRAFFLSLGEGESFSASSCHLNLQMRFQDSAHNQRILRRNIVDNTFSYELTRLGVICYEKSMTMKIGGCLHLPYDEGRSDLSGLNLELPSQHELFLRETDVLLDELMEQIERHKSRAHFYPPDSKRFATLFTYAGAAAAMVAGLATAGPAVLLKSAGIGGLLGGMGLVQIQTDDRYQRLEIVQAIRALRGKLV